MKTFLSAFALFLLSPQIQGVAQTTTPSTNMPQMAHPVKICDESNCTVTAISLSGAVLQFGTNTAPGGWGPTFSNPKLPLVVYYPTSTTALAPNDPLTSVAKELDASMMSVAYTVTYKDAAGASHTIPVPAWVSPPPPPVATFIQYTFTCVNPPAGIVIPATLPAGTPLLCVSGTVPVNATSTPAQ